MRNKNVDITKANMVIKTTTDNFKSSQGDFFKEIKEDVNDFDKKFD